MRIQAGHRSRQRGVALIYAIFGAFVAASMVTVMLAVGGWTSDLAGSKRDRVQAQYLAEGGIESAKKEMQHTIANWRTPPDSGSVDIDGHTVGSFGLWICAVAGVIVTAVMM